MFISLPFLRQETLLYNPDSFHLAYRIKLAFKLRNMEKTWGKNGGTKNVTFDCSSSTSTAQTDTLFKTLKGEMVTTLNEHTVILGSCYNSRNGVKILGTG